MSALDRFTVKQRRKLDLIAARFGLDPEDLARDMAAAYFQLIEDAPEALPGRPLLASVKRVMGGRRG